MIQKYPKVNLEEALNIAQAVYRQNKQCKISTVATALNYSANSSSFNLKKAAAKWYGLVNYDGETIKCEELVTKIFSPLDEDEKISSLQSAFLSFDLFNRLVEHIPFDVEIQKDKIETLAERECDIQVDNKENFVKIFIDSAVFCGILTKTKENTFSKTSGRDFNLKEELKEELKERHEVKTKSSLNMQEYDMKNLSTKEKNENVIINININIDNNTNLQLIKEILDYIK